LKSVANLAARRVGVLVVVFAATPALSLTLHAGGSPPDLYLPAAGWSTFTGVIALVLLVGLVVTSLVGGSPTRRLCSSSGAYEWTYFLFSMPAHGQRFA
jgi:hypothetical protein